MYQKRKLKNAQKTIISSKILKKCGEVKATTDPFYVKINYISSIKNSNYIHMNTIGF